MVTNRGMVWPFIGRGSGGPIHVNFDLNPTWETRGYET